jgi:SWI/SNF-related matrix-associated actin-dependent regulator of chromatin subfamily A3
VRVYQLVAEDTIESRVLEIQNRKRALIQEAFSGIQAGETPRQKKQARLQGMISNSCDYYRGPD